MQLKANLGFNFSDGAEVGGNTGRMHVIVSPNHLQLADLLKDRFADDPATQVVVDRRCAERRKLSLGVSADLRKGERRQDQQKIIEAIIDL